MKDEIVLVDEMDNPIGVAEKLAAHLEGKLHRAISVFLFNSKGEMLLQKRALGKYHSGGLWTNTCCSHPRPNEGVWEAANRRLYEEMGIHAELKKVFDFTYRAELDRGIIEHEFDHVFVGTFDGNPQLNLEEASDFRWIDMEHLQEEIKATPEQFTFWFKEIMHSEKLGLLRERTGYAGSQVAG